MKGGELELAVAPLRGLNMQLGVSYLDTRAEDVPTPAGVLITAQLPQAPLWSLNAEARYEWPALGGQLSVESDAKWNKQQYLELINARGSISSLPTSSPTRESRTPAGDGHWEYRGLLQKPRRSLVSGI